MIAFGFSGIGVDRHPERPYLPSSAAPTGVFGIVGGAGVGRSGTIVGGTSDSGIGVSVVDAGADAAGAAAEEAISLAIVRSVGGRSGVGAVSLFAGR